MGAGPLEVLIAARAKIAHPRHWCKIAIARDRYGRRLVSPTDPKACQWCSMGAIAAVAGPSESASIALGTLETLIAEDEADAICIEAFNDRACTKHADVMALFDKAIELTRKETNEAPITP